jgi:hypothetical protein
MLIDDEAPISHDIVGCYNPRNAIIFITENPKQFEYIEICFECRNTRMSSPKNDWGPFCSNKYELIQKYFKKKGILFGTTEK